MLESTYSVASHLRCSLRPSIASSHSIFFRGTLEWEFCCSDVWCKIYVSALEEFTRWPLWRWRAVGQLHTEAVGWTLDTSADDDCKDSSQLQRWQWRQSTAEGTGSLKGYSGKVIRDWRDVLFYLKNNLWHYSEHKCCGILIGLMYIFGR